MDKLKPVFILLFPLLSFLALSCQNEHIPAAIIGHEAKYPDVQKKYLYQSIIRLANINGDPDFNKLIRDVRKITIYLPPKEDSTYQIKDLSTGIMADGFEQLMEVRTADAARISLWVKESNAQSQYIGFLDTKTEDIFFDIDGPLNLKYLSSLKVADQSSLMDLLKN
ncbi:MAG: DUF4252 domain-containing protein [Saprospiraceae bacterium]